MTTLSTAQQRREQLYGLLGKLPSRDEPVSSRLLWREDHDGWVREELVLTWCGQSIPATVTRPAGPGPFPAVLYHHWHAGQYDNGRKELLEPIGRWPAYGPVLAKRGILSLCIDQINFGDRRGRSELAIFKEMLWRGEVLFGRMVWECLKSLDYLTSRPDVDTDRIAAMGLSLGATLSWWVAALDPRIHACVDLCCMTDFDALIESNGLDEHGIYYYVPSLLEHFTTAQINELICPRWHLSLNGEYDPLTPPAGLDRIDRSLSAVYERAGVPERWRMVRERCAHVETALMRTEVLAFLNQVLLG